MYDWLNTHVYSPFLYNHRSSNWHILHEAAAATTSIVFCMPTLYTKNEIFRTALHVIFTRAYRNCCTHYGIAAREEVVFQEQTRSALQKRQ